MALRYRRYLSAECANPEFICSLEDTFSLVLRQVHLLRNCATFHTNRKILSSTLFLPTVGCNKLDILFKEVKKISGNVRKGIYFLAVNMAKYTVKEIIMYPIKSCKGISLNSAHLSETGELSTRGSPTLLSPPLPTVVPSCTMHRVKMEIPFKQTHAQKFRASALQIEFPLMCSSVISHSLRHRT